MTATSIVPPVETVAPGLVTRPAANAFTALAKLLLGAGFITTLGVAIAGLTVEDLRPQFLHSYLVAFMYSLGIALGALFFVLIQHLARAGWSVVVRRVAENVVGAMWLFPLLFVPLAIGMSDLYHHWVHAELDPAKPAYDALIAGKSAWLNTGGWFLRTAVYLVIWVALAFWFRRTSLTQDRTGDPRLTLRMARVAAPSMILFALSVTFASIDWLMALEPHWYSTMWGVWNFASYFLSFLAAFSLLLMLLQSRGCLTAAVTKEHYHDVGKLLFAFVVFWAYTGFSQYMLIYYGNMPEETEFFKHRLVGSWYGVFVLLCVGHFLVPFAYFMSRHAKRNKLPLAVGATFMLVMNFIDLHWIVMPMLHGNGLHLHWLDFVTLFGVLALFAGVVLRNIQATPLLPERDPRLPESLHFHNI